MITVIIHVLRTQKNSTIQYHVHNTYNKTKIQMYANALVHYKEMQIHVKICTKYILLMSIPI